MISKKLNAGQSKAEESQLFRYPDKRAGQVPRPRAEKLGKKRRRWTGSGTGGIWRKGIIPRPAPETDLFRDK